MIGFKQFISEGKYPLWVRFTVGGIVIKIKNLQKRIENEDDVVKHLKTFSKVTDVILYGASVDTSRGT